MVQLFPTLLFTVVISNCQSIGRHESTRAATGAEALLSQRAFKHFQAEALSSMPQDELCSLTSWLLCFQILDQLLWQPLEPALQLMHSPRPLLSLVAGLGMIALSRVPLGTGLLTTQKDEDVLFSFQLSFCCLQPVP